MNLNKVMLIGNVTRDPEVKNTPAGKSVSSFSIATNMAWTDQNGQRKEKAEFHNIVVWGKLAEICGQYLRKGSKAYIEGRLQTRDWTAQDGSRRHQTEVIAENLIMLDSKNGQRNGQAEADQAASIDQAPQEEGIQVENIPF